MKVREALHLNTKTKSETIYWLLSAILKKSRAELFLSCEEKLTSSQEKEFLLALDRAAKGEPLQYITKSAAFFGREFSVDSRVLIPRPETETLVELGISYLRRVRGGAVLDVGTGSGVVAISLKLELPESNVTATDISSEALGVARKNAKALHAKVSFLHARGIPAKLAAKKWDLVISNPPYISKELDWVSSAVKKWEPKAALYPGSFDRAKEIPLSGAWTAQKILEVCSRARVGATILELSPRVAFYLERKWKKNPRVVKIMREKDLNQRKRFLIIEWQTHVQICN